MIREVSDKDLEQAINLVRDVYLEFVADDYSEQGKISFEAYLQEKLHEASAGLKSEEKRIWAYYQSDEMLGVIATQETSHIALVFVDKHHHKQEIAPAMINFVLEELKKNENVTRVTLNSSFYAVKAYEHMGFVIEGEQQEKDGIVFISMVCEL